MKELLPCPFCGEKSLFFIHEDNSVCCHNCFASTDCFGTKQEGIDAWNKQVDKDKIIKLKTLLTLAQNSVLVELNECYNNSHLSNSPARIEQLKILLEAIDKELE